MMNAILVAVVRFVDIVVTYSLGAVLLALCVVGCVVACQWLGGSQDRASDGRSVAQFRKGSGSLALAALLAVGVICALAGLAVRGR